MDKLHLDRIPINLEQPSVTIRTAQVLGLTAAGALTGMMTSCSALCVPAFMEAPAPLLAKQWKKMFDIGVVAAPILSATSAAIFGLMAYKEPTDSATKKFWLTAAILMPSVLPYTLLIMNPVNAKLQEKASSLAGTSLEDTAAEAGVAKEETVHALVDKWATLNLGRAVIPLVGTLVAAWAAVDKWEVISLAGISFKTGADRMS